MDYSHLYTKGASPQAGSLFLVYLTTKSWSGAADAAPLLLKLHIFLPGVSFALPVHSGAFAENGSFFARFAARFVTDQDYADRRFLNERHTETIRSRNRYTVSPSTTRAKRMFHSTLFVK